MGFSVATMLQMLVEGHGVAVCMGWLLIRQTFRVLIQAEL